MTMATTGFGALKTDLELAYRVRDRAVQARKLLVMLHGVGGNEANFLDWADRVDPDTLLVLVRGPLQLAPQQFAWFRVAFGAHGPVIVAAEAQSSRLQLIHFVQQLQAKYGVEASQTVVAGFSQGGIMSAGLALTAPKVVAGFGLLSGRILPEITPDLASAADLRGLQAFVGHGTDDSKLPVEWAVKSHAWLDALGVAHRYQLYPIDHGISAQMQADFLDWCRSQLSDGGS